MTESVKNTDQIRLYDTWNEKDFTLSSGQPIRIYICGPTVYTDTHVGHLKTYMSFDIIRRVLEEYFKVVVSHMMNITNVDDKIIKGTYQEEYNLPDGFDIDSIHSSKFLPNRKFVDYADRWERNFFEVMDKVGIKRPNVISRVTEYIPEILDFVEEIEKRGYTFVDDGSVYFYGTKYGDIKEDGVSADPNDPDSVYSKDPQNPQNFVLLKKARPYEPGWSSKHGIVRPGWHIECSAMASSVFGSHFDIHAGGIDLKFPHHHNEMLQSNARFKESASHEDWVDHFMHTGHLNIEGLKMSRSLKNFITVSSLLEETSPSELRMLFLLHRWNQPMDYSEKTMKHATFYLQYFENFFKQITSFLLRPTVAENKKYEEREIQFLKYLTQTKIDVDRYLRDNIDTPSVVKALHELASRLFVYISESNESISKEIITDTVAYIQNIFDVFGLYLNRTENKVDDSNQKLLKVISDIRVDLRTIAKDIATKLKPLDKELAKQIPQLLYKLTDKVRDNDLPAIGIQLVDK